MKRLFLSYCKSHIYDIHAILAGSLALIFLYIIKKPIKAYIKEQVNRKAEENERIRHNKERYLKRMNSVLVLLAILISFVFFWILSVFSPLIHFSLPTALMSGAFSLAEYAFIEQLDIIKG